MTEQLLSELITNPENFSRDYIRQPPPFLYSDPQVCCLLKNVESHETSTSMRDFNNPTCPGINHGYLGSRGKVGIPYLVEVGDTTSEEGSSTLLILKTSQPGELSLTYRKEPPTNIRSFNTILDKAPSRCGFPDISNLHYLGGDEFTNEMLIGVILNSTIKLWNDNTGNNFYPYIEYITSTVCQDRSSSRLPITSTRPIGVHLMEFADLGTLVDFTKSPETYEYREGRKIIYPTSHYGDDSIIEVVKVEVVFQIIRQVVASLHLLQKELIFNHGDLKAANIFVSSQPAEGSYEGVDISAPFTCKIADYGKSSLTVETETGPCRIYNRSWLADRYLYMMPFTPIINVQRMWKERAANFLWEEQEPFFIVQGLLDVHLYTRIRHMGLPFFLAYDIYCAIISMLLIPAFYYSFFDSDELIEKIWQPLWFGQDGDRIQLAILSFHDNQEKAQSIATTLELLRNIRLKCNATEILLNNLKH